MLFHDGLGGSIVRSIIMLEKNDQKVDKPQVLSILKMLRSDLRQAVDSGSSLSSKVPAALMEWGAPMRHRFAQLFEETGIRSQWHFEQIWRSLPTALQCLTLNRVAEETLTNILKHSEASEITAALAETSA